MMASLAPYFSMLSAHDSFFGERYLQTENIFFEALRTHQPGDRFWPHQVRQTFLKLGDPVSLSVIEGFHHYRLIIAPTGEFEERVNRRRQLEGHQDYLSPSTQDAIYFTSSHLRSAEMFVRSRPKSIREALPPVKLLRAVCENIVHENRHAMDFQKFSVSHLTRDLLFSFEYRAHIEASIWSALQGDPRDWFFYSQSPQGPDMAFRRYFDAHY